MLLNKTHNSWLKPLLQLALLAGIAVALYYLRNIVFYFLIAALVTLIGRPLYRAYYQLRITRRVGLPGSVAALLTLLSLVAAFALVLWALAPLLITQTEALLSLDPGSLAVSLQEPLNALEQRLSRLGMNSTQIITEAKANLEQTASHMMRSGLLTSLSGFATNVGGFIMGIFAVLFMSFFFLKQPGTLHQIFITIVPDNQNDKMANAIEDVKRLLRRYILGLLCQVLCVSGLLALGLWIIGYQNALVIGLFGGLLNLVPYLGPLIGSGVGMLFYLTTHMDQPFYSELLPMLALIAAIFLTVQMIDGFLLQPFLFGASIKAHPLEIFVVILIGGQVGGIIGMIIAIPTYTTLRVLASTFYPQNRFVRALMGKQASPGPGTETGETLKTLSCQDSSTA
ncbi:MAG: AI-2E family transporter [Bacteroidetes bacterium]|nr:AI-2E family transporter [Bacteroidota bacterium]